MVVNLGVWGGDNGCEFGGVGGGITDEAGFSTSMPRAGDCVRIGCDATRY